MPYSSDHRALLRAVATRGVLALPQAEALVRPHCAGDEHPSVKDMVKEINDQIRPLKQTIKLTTDELTDEQVLVFLSLGSDDASKAQTVFTATELDLFRVLIENIMTTDRRQVSAIAALNLVSQIKGTLSKHDAEKLLKTWCAMRYLDYEDGAYRLGIRAVHEFESYLRQNMPDSIEDCSLCKQVVFRGCNCPACGLAVHTRCLNKYLEKVEKWPCCKVDYTGLDDLTQPQYLTRTQQSTIYEPEEEIPQNIMAEDSSDTSQNMSALLPSRDSLVHSQDTLGHSQEDVDMTQASQLGISQSDAVRRRKRLRE